MFESIFNKFSTWFLNFDFGFVKWCLCRVELFYTAVRSPSQWFEINQSDIWNDTSCVRTFIICVQYPWTIWNMWAVTAHLVLKETIYRPSQLISRYDKRYVILSDPFLLVIFIRVSTNPGWSGNYGLVEPMRVLDTSVMPWTFKSSDIQYGFPKTVAIFSY